MSNSEELSFCFIASFGGTDAGFGEGEEVCAAGVFVGFDTDFGPAAAAEDGRMTFDTVGCRLTFGFGTALGTTAVGSVLLVLAKLVLDGLTGCFEP